MVVETWKKALEPEAAEEIREKSAEVLGVKAVELEETWGMGLEILEGPYEAAEDSEAEVVREVAAVRLTQAPLGVMPVVGGVAGEYFPTHLQGSLGAAVRARHCQVPSFPVVQPVPLRQFVLGSAR